MTNNNNLHNDQSEPFDGIKENRETRPPAYFYLLFFGLIIWAVFFCAYYLFSGWSSHGEFQEKMQIHQEQMLNNRQIGK